jgi:hypothetical protein
MYSVLRNARPCHMICEYPCSQCSYLFRIWRQNVRHDGEYTLPCLAFCIINIIAVVTIIMEPMVSIITSYHGYFCSCISIIAVVSHLSWELAEKELCYFKVWGKYGIGFWWPNLENQFDQNLSIGSQTDGQVLCHTRSFHDHYFLDSK